MSLVSAEQVAVAFGQRVILEDATFAIQPGDRIGLVGPNGSGKSTLLRILAGTREPDAGAVHVARGARVGYLPQDILEIPGGTLVESVRSMVGGRDRLEEVLRAVEEDLAAAEDDELRLELSQRLADLHQEQADFEERYGRHRAEKILMGLGFHVEDLDRPVEHLSGGWKMRVALAGLLLLEPDLLLLDEPTNHLDVPSLQWFDDFLRRSRKAVMLVSHDRDFLNRQIGRVMSLEIEGLRSYAGDYEAYRAQRAEEEQNLELRARRQEAQRAEAMRFIERFRAKATKARQVQSRLRLLEREETVTVREARATVRFRFPAVPRSGREVIRLEQVAKRFGDKIIYRGLTRTVAAGARIAIVGVNGAGKTTLLKMIAGELAADAGTIGLGHNVQAAYYAQHHAEKLDGGKTVLEQIWSLVPDEPQTFVRGVLGAFLFHGDDVDKPIRVLSGGERARVALARLLVLPSNLLLMDEPTNHLDLDSSERLVEALKDYGGTLVFVSHNRSFINQLANEIWEVVDGDVSDWPGNLDDYLYHLEQLGRPMGGVPVAAPRIAPAPVETDRQRRQREAREREERGRRLRPIQTEIAKLEAEIAALEAEKKELEPKLSDPSLYDDFQRAQPILGRYREIDAALTELLASWEQQQELLAAATGS